MKKRLFCILCILMAITISFSACGEDDVSSSSSEAEDGPDNPPISGMQDWLGNMIALMQTCDPASFDVVSSAIRDGNTSVMVTRDFLNELGNILQENESRLIGEDAPVEELVQNEHGMSNLFSFYIYGDDSVSADGHQFNGAFVYLKNASETEINPEPSEMYLQLLWDDLNCVYLYDSKAYDDLAQAITDSLHIYSNNISGNYAFLDESGLEAYEHRSLISSFMVGDRLVMAWEGRYESGANSMVAEIDPATGKVISSQAFNDAIRFAQPEYGTASNSYRVFFESSVLYCEAGSDSQNEIYEMPDIEVFEGRDLYWNNAPFDIDRKGKQLAWAGESGIMVGDLDGNNAKQVLAYQDLGPLVTGQDLPDYKDEQLIYCAPILVNEGKQLAATMYLLSDGDYEGLPIGFTIVDLASNEISDYPGNIPWLSAMMRRVDERSVGIMTHDGYQIIDTQTLESSFAEFDIYTSATSDYNLFAQVESAATPLGAVEQSIYLYLASNPAETVKILSADMSWIMIEGVFPDYILCTYDDYNLPGHFIVSYDLEQLFSGSSANDGTTPPGSSEAESSGIE